VNTKDRKDLCFYLALVLLIGKENERKHQVVYQLDVYFPRMELMKEIEMRYFDTLLLIVYAEVRLVLRSTQQQAI
jgi:hypothetical protein